MKHAAKFLTVVLSAGLLVACSSGVKLDENAGKGAPIDNRSGGGAGSSGSGDSTRGVAPVTVGQNALDPLNDPNNPLSKRSVYFDYDSFVVRDDFRPLIEAHARYLNANRGRKVILQGNTDDRGSREYNLALGQKRAEAVRRALTALGVSDNQLEAVSFGEEKPKATGADEASWAENRRVDLAYQ